MISIIILWLLGYVLAVKARHFWAGLVGCLVGGTVVAIASTLMAMFAIEHSLGVSTFSVAPEVVVETVFATAIRFSLLAFLAFGISRWKFRSKRDPKKTPQNSSSPPVVPASPAITDERAYLEWFVLYKSAATRFGTLSAPVPDELIEAFVSSGLKMLRNNKGAEALFSHVAAMAHDYQVRLKPFIDGHGGIANCSPAIKGAALNMLTNIEIGIEFLEKKHHYHELDDLLRAIRQ